jgi:hypothetical protein
MSSTIHQHRPSKEKFWRATLRQWQISAGFLRPAATVRAEFLAWQRSLAKRDVPATYFMPVGVASEPATPTAGALELVLDGAASANRPRASMPQRFGVSWLTSRRARCGDLQLRVDLPSSRHRSEGLPAELLTRTVAVG